MRFPDEIESVGNTGAQTDFLCDNTGDPPVPDGGFVMIVSALALIALMLAGSTVFVRRIWLRAAGIERQLEEFRDQVRGQLQLQDEAENRRAQDSQTEIQKVRHEHSVQIAAQTVVASQILEGVTGISAIAAALPAQVANLSSQISGLAPTGKIPPLAGIPRSLSSGGGGFAVFDSADAQQINKARLDHLAGLEIPLEGKTVLDVGCGVGHLSGFFDARGARVVCVDARPENIVRLQSLYPGRAAHVVNVELDRLSELGRFDIVFCYGLLYHIENPIAALRNIASCCRETLLLETVVTDYSRPTFQLVDEPPTIKNQAVSGFGCRPSPAFVAMALSRMGFSFVYTSDTHPDHPDFNFEWTNDGEWSRDGKLLRCIFVASRTKLSNPHLTLLLEAPETPMPDGGQAGILNPPPDQIWLDVGAHNGEKTLAAAREDPALRVYAFEPNLASASRLMGASANYVVLPVAVAEEDGSAPFYLDRYEAASSLLPFVPEGLAQWIGGGDLAVTATFTVPTMRLDTFLDGTGIRKVAYLKIDAQGADLAVIRSAGERLKDIDRISLEVQTTPFELYRGASRKEDVLQFLTSAGFRLVETVTQSFDQEENLTFIRTA